MKLKTIDFKYLEYLSFWQERLTGTHLGKLLGVERTHAHRSILSPYKDLHGEDLVRRSRVWTARDPENVRPHYGPASVKDLFRFLDGLEFLQDLPGEALGVPLEEVRIDLPVEQNLTAFRALYAAAAQKRVVRVLYRSRKREAEYLFSPHAVVRTASRPHFRGFMKGFEGKDGKFTDLVPARVLAVEIGAERDYVAPDEDTGWNTRIDVQLRLSEDLPESRRKTLLQEYAPVSTFENGRLTIPDVRTCLAPYLCRHLRYRVYDDLPVEVWVPIQAYDFC